MPKIKTVIFDLGGVLIDWSPKHLFTDTYFDAVEKRDYFLTQICSPDWNEQQDAGRSIVYATEELIREYPEWEAPIRDFYGRWTDMLGGPIAGTVDLFRKIKEEGKLKTYALTNWQEGLFDIALVRYNFLHWFDGRVVSGTEKTRKPFPEFYQILFDRYQVNPAETVFIDDSLRNIKAGEALGLKGVHFTDPDSLKTDLLKLGVLQG